MTALTTAGIPAFLMADPVSPAGAVAESVDSGAVDAAVIGLHESIVGAMRDALIGVLRASGCTAVDGDDVR